MKKVYDRVDIKRRKDFPFEDRTKSKYFVEISSGDSTFIEGFDKKNQAKVYGESLKGKTKIFKNQL